MHFDRGYVERMKWNDYQSDFFPYASLEDTALLTLAGKHLGIEELPVIQGSFTATQIYEFVDG